MLQMPMFPFGEASHTRTASRSFSPVATESSMAAEMEPILCRFAEFGCSALMLPSLMDNHMKEDAEEHVELLARALQAERASKEHLVQAMTNAQSRCRKTTNENSSLRRDLASAQEEIRVLREKNAHSYSLGDDEKKIRNVICSFLYKDTPLLIEPSIREKATLSAIVPPRGLNSPTAEVKRLQARITELEDTIQKQMVQISLLQQRLNRLKIKGSTDPNSFELYSNFADILPLTSNKHAFKTPGNVLLHRTRPSPFVVFDDELRTESDIERLMENVQAEMMHEIRVHHEKLQREKEKESAQEALSNNKKLHKHRMLRGTDALAYLCPVVVLDRLKKWNKNTEPLTAPSTSA